MLKRIYHRIVRQPLSGNMRIGEKRISGKKFAGKVIKRVDKGLKNMGNEALETKEMAGAFFKLLEHKLKLNDRVIPPTEEEVKEAIEQLKDVGRLSVFTTAVIIPGGAISLMGLEILAKKFGIKFTFIPSSFRKNSEWKHPDGRSAGKINKRGRNISDVESIEE